MQSRQAWTRDPLARSVTASGRATAPQRRKARQAFAWRAAIGAAVCGLAAMAPSGAMAQMAGILQATIRISTGCAVTGNTGAPTGIALGTLDFGMQAPTFTGTVNASPTGGVGGAGATTILCSSEITSLSVSVSPGLYAGEGGAIGPGARAMRSVVGNSFIPYEVYQDSGHTTPYPLSGSATVAVPAGGNAFTLPVYGQVIKNGSQTLSSGIYADTLIVTLNF